MGTTITCRKCKTSITSTSVHDFKRCKCGAVFVDGGDEYLRFGGELKDIEFNDQELQDYYDELQKKQDTEVEEWK